MNIITNQADKYNIKFIVFICIVSLISPIVGFVLSILFFRQRISVVIFILFSFYFGWFYEPQLDLLNHYNHFKSNIGKSLLEQWSDPDTMWLGGEFYPVIFKYIVGQISSSPNFFSACACAAYSSLFILFLEPLKDLYTQKMHVLSVLAFLGIVFTVEFYWFLGFRFWSGAFVFLIFYIRYIRTGEKKYLYLSFLCNLFHFSHFVLCLAALVNEFLKNRFALRYIFVAIGYLFRFFEIDLIPLLAKLPFLNLFVKAKSLNVDSITSIAQRTTLYREQGNMVYWLRSEIVFWGIIMVLFLLFKNLKNLENNNSRLWGLILILTAFVNISYMDMTVFLRVFKFVDLMLFIYLFLAVCKNDLEYSRTSLLWSIIILCFLVFYSFITPIVEQRNFLFSIQLWFNNFL